MSTSTTHFGLVLPETSDKWNPLLYENPAIEDIDNQMYLNQNHAVQTATHVRSGGINQLVREVQSAPMFSFIATDDFHKGDTFTVDGNVYSARLADGSTLVDNSFRINSNVLCLLQNNILTIYSNSAVVDTSEIEERIDNIEEEIGNTDYSDYGNTLSKAIYNVGVKADTAVTGVNKLNNNLVTLDGTPFVFDYQDGKFGFNTSETRGADTFTPFSSGEIDVFTEVQTSSATSSSAISFSPLSKGNYIIFGGYSTKFTPTSDVSLILAPYNATGLVEYCNPIIIEVLTDNTDISSMFSVTSQSNQQISVCKIHDSIDVSNPTTVKNQYTATEDCWFAVMRGSNAPIYGIYGTALFHTYSFGGSMYLLHMKQGQTVTYGTSSSAIGILFN